MKKYLLLLLLVFSSCEEKVVYKTQEEMQNLRKQQAWNRYHVYLPKESQLIDILPCIEEDWCIVKIRNNYYLYRMNFSGNGTTEIMVPFNYIEK